MGEVPACNNCIAPRVLAEQNASHQRMAELLQAESEAGMSVPDGVDTDEASLSLVRAMVARDLHALIVKGRERAASLQCDPAGQRACARLACLSAVDTEIIRRAAEPATGIRPDDHPDNDPRDGY